MTLESLPPRQRTPFLLAVLQLLEIDFPQTAKVFSDEARLQGNPTQELGSSNVLLLKWQATSRLQQKVKEQENQIKEYKRRISMFEEFSKITICLNSIPNPNPSIVLNAHQAQVSTLIYHPQLLVFVSASTDGTLKVWKLEGGRCNLIKILSDTKMAITDACFDAEGKHLAAATIDGSITIWDFTTSTIRKQISQHGVAVQSIAFRNDSEFLFSMSADGTVKSWDIVTGYGESPIQIKNYSGRGAIFAPTGNKLVACADTRNNVLVYRMDTKSELSTLSGHTQAVEATLFASVATYQHLAENGQATIVPTNYENEQLLSTTDPKYRLLLESVCPILFSCGRDNTVRMWDCLNQKCVRTFLGHSNWVKQLELHPDGNILFSCSHDTTIRAWDILDGSCQKSIKNPQSSFLCTLQFSRACGVLGTGGISGVVCFYECSGDEVSHPQLVLMQSVATRRTSIERRDELQTTTQKSIEVMMKQKSLEVLKQKSLEVLKQKSVESEVSVQAETKRQVSSEVMKPVEMRQKPFSSPRGTEGVILKSPRENRTPRDSVRTMKVGSDNIKLVEVKSPRGDPKSLVDNIMGIESNQDIGSPIIIEPSNKLIELQDVPDVPDDPYADDISPISQYVDDTPHEGDMHSEGDQSNIDSPPPAPETPSSPRRESSPAPETPASPRGESSPAPETPASPRGGSTFPSPEAQASPRGSSPAPEASPRTPSDSPNSHRSSLPPYSPSLSVESHKHPSESSTSPRPESPDPELPKVIDFGSRLSRPKFNSPNRRASVAGDESPIRMGSIGSNDQKHSPVKSPIARAVRPTEASIRRVVPPTKARPAGTSVPTSATAPATKKMPRTTMDVPATTAGRRTATPVGRKADAGPTTSLGRKVDTHIGSGTRKSEAHAVGTRKSEAPAGSTRKDVMTRKAEASSKTSGSPPATKRPETGKTDHFAGTKRSDQIGMRKASTAGTVITAATDGAVTRKQSTAGTATTPATEPAVLRKPSVAGATASTDPAAGSRKPSTSGTATPAGTSKRATGTGSTLRATHATGRAVSNTKSS